MQDWQVFVRDLRNVSSSQTPRILATFCLEAAIAQQASQHQEVLDEAIPRNGLLGLAWERLRPVELRSEYGVVWILAVSSLLQGTGAEGPFERLTLGEFQLRDRLKEALRLHPTDQALRTSLALIDTRKAHRDAIGGEFLAGVSYRRAQEVRSARPQTSEALSNVGLAVNALKPVATAEPPSPLAQLHYGFFLQLKGNTSHADTLLTDVAVSTKDPWIAFMAHFLRARTAVASKSSNATSLIEQALFYKPRVPSASRLLATVLYLHGEGQPARSVLSSMDLNADDPWLWFPFGDAYLLSDRLTAVRSLTW